MAEPTGLGCRVNTKRRQKSSDEFEIGVIHRESDQQVIVDAKTK